MEPLAKLDMPILNQFSCLSHLRMNKTAKNLQYPCKHLMATAASMIETSGVVTSNCSCQWITTITRQTKRISELKMLRLLYKARLLTASQSRTRLDWSGRTTAVILRQLTVFRGSVTSTAHQLSEQKGNKTQRWTMTKIIN